MEREAIRAKIKETLELATISGVSLQAMQLLRDPDVNVKRITETVSLDQSMTSKILRLVNSSFYGFQGRIGSLSQGIVLLGLNTVRNIILSVSVLQAFSGGKTCMHFDAARFWEHSVGTAFVAKHLAEHIKAKQPEDAFTGGLLHDIGRVFMLQFLRSDLEEIISLVIEEDIRMLQAEEKQLGVDHAWIGHAIVKNWHFPALLCYGIGYHHSPSLLRERGPEFAFAALIHLADIICRGMDIGCGGDDIIPDCDMAAWQRLSLSMDDVKTVVRKVDDNLYQIEDFLNALHS